jgi:hypothetical protein
LVREGILVAHQEVDVEAAIPDLVYKVIQPELVDFISYPYEWSFSQLKDAALLTIAATRKALDKGMILKDASAYNIQFYHGKPVLIDTLSFEKYQEGTPWVAYRQFCQHFLAPLALMAYQDIRLSQLMRVYIDGVPLDLASQLLPWKTRLNFGLGTHLHLHANAQKRYAGQAVSKEQTTGRQFSKIALLGLLDSLESTVRGLKWQPVGTEWGDYYDATNYTRKAFDAKGLMVESYLKQANPAKVWDLGANTGVFSQIASSVGANVVSFDIDPAAVEKNYRDCRQQKVEKILPLVLDLTNPSPAIGWSNRERSSLLERGPVDVVMALALVHHLAISNNVPLTDLAEFFSQAGTWLIIEFVPKEDSQVQRLLTSREDIFPHYNQTDFEAAFSQYFEIRQAQPVADSKRTLYLMEKK